MSKQSVIYPNSPIIIVNPGAAPPSEKTQQKTRTLTVTFIKAKNLKSSNYFAKNSSDCFCTFQTQFDSGVQSTEVCFNTTEPEWNFTTEIKLQEPLDQNNSFDNENEFSEIFFINVWGRHRISSNTFLGKVEIPISLIISHLNHSKGESFECWFKLTPKVSNKITQDDYNRVSGSILLRFNYTVKVIDVYTQPPPVPSTLPSPVSIQFPSIHSDNSSQLYPQLISNSSVYNSSFIPNVQSNPTPNPSLAPFFKCNQCQHVFSSDSIADHINHCYSLGRVVEITHDEKQVTTSQQDQTPPSYNNNTNHIYQNDNENNNVNYNFAPNNEYNNTLVNNDVNNVNNNNANNYPSLIQLNDKNYFPDYNTLVSVNH